MNLRQHRIDDPLGTPIRTSFITRFDLALQLMKRAPMALGSVAYYSRGSLGSWSSSHCLFHSASASRFEKIVFDRHPDKQFNYLMDRRRTFNVYDMTTFRSRLSKNTSGQSSSDLVDY